MEGRFKGRDVIDKPLCPFCGMQIKKPGELDAGMPQEMPVGACKCGAVYTCDVTGHNLGTAMIEALVFACNGDWDLAWDLLPDDDYLVGELEEYDYESHLIVHSGAYEGRNVTGVLYFVKLHDDVLEVTEQGFRSKLEKKSIHPVSNAGYKKSEKTRFTKKDIEILVTEYNLDEIDCLAGQDKKIIRYLQRLLYSADDLLRMRAAEALGRATAIISDYDPKVVTRLIKNLFISISDTAASSWGAIEAIGEIISHKPRQYVSYTPQLYTFIPDRELLPEVLRALGRITGSEPMPFQKIRFSLIPFLKDENPEVRAYTIIIMGNLKAIDARDDIASLTEDNIEIDIYEKGVFKKISISDIAASTLEKIIAK
ncbi:DVU0298 family protein [Thermodesulfobacteriota bacterium]